MEKTFKVCVQSRRTKIAISGFPLLRATDEIVRRVVDNA